MLFEINGILNVALNISGFKKAHRQIYPQRHFCLLAFQMNFQKKWIYFSVHKFVLGPIHIWFFTFSSPINLKVITQNDLINISQIYMSFSIHYRQYSSTHPHTHTHMNAHRRKYGLVRVNSNIFNFKFFICMTLGKSFSQFCLRSFICKMEKRKPIASISKGLGENYRS